MPRTTPEQSREAIMLGNAKRLQRARLRESIAAGDTDWHTVVLDPPECVHGLLLPEVLQRYVPWISRHRVEVLADDAFRAGIHLMVRVERAPMRTREWVVANTLVRGASGQRARRRQRVRGGMRKTVVLP